MKIFVVTSLRKNEGSELNIIVAEVWNILWLQY